MPYNYKKFTTSKLWIGGILLLAVVIIWMLLDNFILHRDERVKAALESGQRFEILLKTGEIKGRAPMLEEEPASEAVEPELNIQENIPSADINSQDMPAEEPEVEDPLAWMGQDFIGPRLPDDAVKALLSSDLSSNMQPVNNVSIKDISAKPIVVIIIKNVGLNPSFTREVMELPKEINIGFSAYSDSLDEWVKKVQEVGHEVILNIPMEAVDSQINKPGPYSLITQATDAENQTRLKMVLGLASGYSAIYSDNNEIFTRSPDTIKPLLDALKKENKHFVYGGGYTNNMVIQVADSINYPVLVNDLVLDDDISSAAVSKKFVEMERIANEKGYVVAMAHPYPATISILESWLQTAPQKNLLVSPVSLLLGKNISK